MIKHSNKYFEIEIPCNASGRIYRRQYKSVKELKFQVNYNRQTIYIDGDLDGVTEVISIFERIRRFFGGYVEEGNYDKINSPDPFELTVITSEFEDDPDKIVGLDISDVKPITQEEWNKRMLNARVESEFSEESSQLMIRTVEGAMATFKNDEDRKYYFANLREAGKVIENAKDDYRQQLLEAQHE